MSWVHIPGPAAKDFIVFETIELLNLLENDEKFSRQTGMWTHNYSQLDQYCSPTELLPDGRLWNRFRAYLANC